MLSAQLTHGRGRLQDRAQLLNEELRYWEQCYVDCFTDGEDYRTLNSVRLRIQALKDQLEALRLESQLTP